MMNDKMVNRLAWIICFALCIQRLSMALGSISWGIAILLFIILIYKTKRTGQSLAIEESFKGYYQAYLICAVSFIPSIFVSSDIGSAMKLFFEMWLYRVIPFFMVTVFIKDTALLKKILFVFLSVINIDCLVAATQVFLGVAPRGWGFGGNTLHLASILCVIIPMLLVVVLDDTFLKKEKRFACISLFFCFIGVIAGLSRGAWLTLAIVLPLLSIKYIMNNTKRIIASCSIIVLVIGIFISSPKLLYRVESISNVTTDTSNLARLAVWQSGLNMLRDHPVTGVGLSSFVEVYKIKYTLPDDKIGLSHAHNNFVQIGAETGIVGLLGFLYLNCYIIIRNFAEWKKDQNPFSLMLLSGWMGFTIFGMFDLTIDASAIMKILWFLLGTILVLKSNQHLKR